MKLSSDKVTRVEVVNHCEEHGGREFVFTKDNIIVDVHYQDDGRTLKIFIEDKHE